MDDRLSLSVGYFVTGADDWLLGALQHACDLAAERIVLDASQNPRTALICQITGARHVPIDWTGDWSAARETLITAATGEWVVLLETHERLELPADWHQAITPDERALGITVSACDRTGRVLASQLEPRLIRRGAGVRFEGKARDAHPFATLSLPLRRVAGAKIRQEPRELPEPAPTDYPTDGPVAAFQAGLAASARGQWQAAIAAFAAMRGAEAPVLSPAHALGGATIETRLRLDAGDLAGALETAEWALARHPGYPEILLLKGRALRQLGRLDEAVALFVQAAASDAGAFLAPVRPIAVGPAPWLERAAILWLTGNRTGSASALAHARAAEGLSPEEQRAIGDFAAIVSQLEHDERPAPEAAPQAKPRDLAALLDATAGQHNNPVLNMVRAALFVRTGRVLEAIGTYLDVLFYDTGDLDAFSGLVAVLSAIGQGDLAARVAAYGSEVAAAIETPWHPPAVSAGATAIALDAPLQERLETFLALGHPQISACMIVKNEEECLTTAIASLAPWIAELIVIDTGSTDRTVEIARAAGARMGYYEWDSDFAAARNASIKDATHEWILIHDADEILEVKDPIAWKRALYKRGVGGYVIDVLSPRTDAAPAVHGGLHLFRRDPRVRFQYTLHETVSRSLEELGMPLVTLEFAVLNHTGYLDAAVEKHGKNERNLISALLGVVQDPDSARAYASLLGAAFTVGQYRLAEASFLKMRELEEAGTYDARTITAFSIYCGALCELGRRDEAQDLLDQEILKLSNQTGLFEFRSGLRRERGDNWGPDVDALIDWLVESVIAERVRRIAQSSEALRAFARS